MDNRGITLIELLMVTAVVGILALALGFEYQGWIGNYKKESRTKEIYTDLMDARIRAMQRNRAHFFTLDSDTQYTVYEDTNPVPDGNRTLEVAADTQLLQKRLNPEEAMTWNGDDDIQFTSRGLSNDNKTICIFSDYNPDYDCVIIAATRINIGRIIDQGGGCNDANCEAR